jgi:hypothetical protein
MGLFPWFSKKPPAGAEPVGGESPLTLPGVNLDESIAAVAAQRSELAIRDRARQFSRQYGPEVIPELMRRFDVMTEPPPSFSAREPSALAWAGCWRSALFEILYHYREHALPVFREMARNGYQGTAFVLLCRLAAEGVDRQRVDADLRSQMPDLPFSVRCDVAGQLLGLARQDPALATVLEDLRQAPAFEQALAEVRPYVEERGGPPGGGRERPAGPPRGAVGRRALLVAIAIAFGVGAAAAVVGSTGVWGAALVGALAVAVSAAVLFLVEMAVFTRM